MEQDLLTKLTKLLDLIAYIWRYKITFSSTASSITIGDVVLSVFYLTVAFILAKTFKRHFSKLLNQKFRLRAQEAATIENVIYYILLTVLMLLALHFAHVPLSTFNVIGGAIVLGIGFGSQSLVNNFMSGLVIMLEKPVKIGDVIEINKLTGVVEHLGARSTRILSMYNTHFIIPNSTLLQDNVINWTMHDHKVLVSISLRVSYSSEMKKVQSALKQAVKATPGVCEEPEPIALFDKFGSSAMNFSVLFALKMKDHLERKIIESNVRVKIEEALREEGIVISYHQADLHIDMAKPIEFKNVTSADQ